MELDLKFFIGLCCRLKNGLGVLRFGGLGFLGSLGEHPELASTLSIACFAAVVVLALACQPTLSPKPNNMRAACRGQGKDSE